MPEQSENGEVTVSVDHVLEGCSSCIHRVSNRVRTTNPTAYDPTIVAIGPFHRDKADLKNMEHQKERYLEQILESRGELDNDEDHLLGFVHCLECMSFSPDVVSPSCVMENIISATVLKQAGVSFNKAKDGEEGGWLDIEFKNNKIIVPALEVSDTTESKLRNMMAYEHYLPCSAQKYVTDYVFFMSRLIHDAKDAQILRRYGIISNWLGGDEAVYQLFNRMGTQAEISLKFSYINVFHDVNLYCGRRRNRWIAMLRRDYFNSPWKLISFIAGVVLLGVGIVQMVFAILSYGKQN